VDLEKGFIAEQLSHTEIDLYLTQGKFIDIGIPEDYRRAQDLLS